jgi:hypothetical protein
VKRALLLAALVACGSKKPAAQQPQQQGSAAGSATPVPHDDQVDERSADDGRAPSDSTPQPLGRTQQP